MKLSSIKNTPPWARATAIALIFGISLAGYHEHTKNSKKTKASTNLPADVREVTNLKPAALPSPSPEEIANLPELQGHWESIEKFEDMNTYYRLTLEQENYQLTTHCVIVKIPHKDLQDNNAPTPTPPPQDVHGKWKLIPTKRYPILELYPQNQQVSTVRRQIIAWTRDQTKTTTFTSMAPKGGETMIWKKTKPQP